VLGFSFRMCGNPEDAKEVTQETLLTMARSVGDFRGDASLSTWLYTIARSFCIKSRRRSKGAPAHHEPLEAARDNAAEPTTTPEQMLLGRETRDKVIAALARLEPAAREAVVLRDIEGLTAAEVARITRASVAAVKSRLHRARAALREHLLSAVGGEALPPPTPSSCPDVLTMLSRKLEDEISPELCATMEEHVAACSRCSGLCDSLKKTLALCKALPAPPIPEHVQNSIRQAVAAALAKAK